MYYAIMSEDVENSLEMRVQTRPMHIERIKKLKEEGRLLLVGPHPAVDSEDPGEAGFTGSLVVAAFDSLEDAKAWANDDPYAKAGIYAKVVVKPFKNVVL
jgi:uncharacterized protein YciI